MGNSKLEIRMTNQIQNSKSETGRTENDGDFDLEERTAVVGENIIRLAKSVKSTATTMPLVNQLVRSGTSVGANYCEANDAESRKDFRNKIALCRKESHETKYWLRMLATAEPEAAEKARRLWQEAKELNLIFGSICRKTTK
jgi:four helix bundle protein